MYILWDGSNLDYYYYFLGDGPIKDAYHKGRKIELWGSPQLILLD